MARNQPMVIKMYELAGADERRYSPYCWRIRMALAHKALPVETIPWRFVEKEKIAFSGQEKVPVIVDGETIVSDSWQIASYLEAAYPKGTSLFGSTEAKAEALFIKHWTETVLHPSLFSILVMDIFKHLHPKDKEYFRTSKEAAMGKSLEAANANAETATSQLKTILQPIRKTLESQPFIAGEQPNFADYIIFAPFQWARVISPQKLLAAEDPIYVWRDRMLALYDGLASRAIGYAV